LINGECHFTSGDYSDSVGNSLDEDDVNQPAKLVSKIDAIFEKQHQTKSTAFPTAIGSDSSQLIRAYNASGSARGCCGMCCWEIEGGHGSGKAFLVVSWENPFDRNIYNAMSSVCITDHRPSMTTTQQEALRQLAMPGFDGHSFAGMGFSSGAMCCSTEGLGYKATITMTSDRAGFALVRVEKHDPPSPSPSPSPARAASPAVVALKEQGNLAAALKLTSWGDASSHIDPLSSSGIHGHETVELHGTLAHSTVRGGCYKNGSVKITACKDLTISGDVYDIGGKKPSETSSSVMTLVAQDGHLQVVGDVYRSTPSSGEICGKTIGIHGAVYKLDGILTIRSAADMHIHGDLYKNGKGVTLECGGRLCVHGEMYKNEGRISAAKGIYCQNDYKNGNVAGTVAPLSTLEVAKRDRA
jgi:hypothetical protein